MVEGPQFLLLHETLDFALRLANTFPATPIDRSILLISTDFVNHRGAQSLTGLQAIGLNGGGTSNEVFLWANESQQIQRLVTAMRPVLSAAIQPPVVRNRVSCVTFFISLSYNNRAGSSHPFLCVSQSKKLTMTPPTFPNPPSATSLVNSSSASPPPPPPPPHKRNYAMGEARYQNHNSPPLVSLIGSFLGYSCFKRVLDFWFLS